MTHTSIYRSAALRLSVGLSVGLSMGLIALIAPAQWAYANEESTTATPVSDAEAESEYIDIDVDDAQLSVQRDATSGDKLRIKGSGWTNQAGTGSTITVKLNYLKDGVVAQYQRGGSDTGNPDPDDVFSHPKSGVKDRTIFWQFVADPDGSFDVTQTLPLNLSPGQMLTINFASGLVEGDTSRTVVTPSLRVEGQQWIAPPSDKPTCQSPVASPEAIVSEFPDENNTLLVEGRGFCNTLPNGGGARVVIKFNFGGIKHFEEFAVHPNLTVWDIVVTNDADGSFSHRVRLPEDTRGQWGTPTPLSEGEHTLNVLSGSLQSGDISRSIPLTFINGEYSPNGVPDPIDYKADLIPANRAGVSIRPFDTDLIIEIPEGQPGDWVYISTYLPDGSPRIPWKDQWFRLSDTRSVLLPNNEDIPEGPLKFVVQNGNRGQRGELIGWVDYEFKAISSTTTTTAPTSAYGVIARELGLLNNSLTTLEKTIDTQFLAPNEQDNNEDQATQGDTAGADETEQEIITRRIVRRRSLVAPTTATNRVQGPSYDSRPISPVDPPVTSIGELNFSNAGNVTGTVEGEQLAIKVPDLWTGQWANLYVYPDLPGQEPIDAGWVQVDQSGTVYLDTSGLPDGDYAISLSDRGGNLVGWLDLGLGSSASLEAQQQGLAPQNAQADTIRPVIKANGLMGPTDWVLILASLIVTALTAAGVSLTAGRKHA
ncbi:hypothetical protein NXS13_03330 [Corynebacterium sp. ES2730-CONJ]|uniref:hypothetical protein n=1 Tax=Corynebacterium sp. ES2730-CONJ TaxID=2973941 RepID=UPI00216AF7AE|nr:hypothetical protein [Corynebacterium sp. ES2730-CONJ]MCS4531541.1 hypothetical protein [Corynebacterium sp. ES2730-CONJ]